MESELAKFGLEFPFFGCKLNLKVEFNLTQENLMPPPSPRDRQAVPQPGLDQSPSVSDFEQGLNIPTSEDIQQAAQEDLSEIGAIAYRFSR
jgi:hypothetical protein